MGNLYDYVSSHRRIVCDFVMNKIFEFCQKHSIPLSDRSCTDDFLWDGKTIAIYRSDNEVEEKLMLDAADILHEVAHFLVASPVEREFPDWGCDNFGFFGAVGGYTYYKDAEKFVGVLTKSEQQWREACADFLGCYLCRVFGVPISLEAEASFKYERGDGGYDPVLGSRAKMWVEELIQTL